jgi:hypothetical protein
MDLNRFRTGYLRADALDPRMRTEATITEVKYVTFDDGVSKPVVCTDLTKPIVLNQTRLEALIGAFGPDSANAIGQKVVVSRGMTKYQGHDEACIVLDPVVAPRLGAEPARPRISVSPRTGREEPPESDDDPDRVPF